MQCFHRAAKFAYRKGKWISWRYSAFYSCYQRWNLAAYVPHSRLCIASTNPPQEYSVEHLSPTQVAMLEDLHDYGIIWQRKVSAVLTRLHDVHKMVSQRDSKRFSPTRLATTLTSSSPPLPTASGVGSHSQSQGFIILETNYRLYAYTGKHHRPVSSIR